MWLTRPHVKFKPIHQWLFNFSSCFLDNSALGLQARTARTATMQRLFAKTSDDAAWKMCSRDLIYPSQKGLFLPYKPWPRESINVGNQSAGQSNLHQSILCRRSSHWYQLLLCFHSKITGIKSLPNPWRMVQKCHCAASASVTVCHEFL